MSSKDFIFVDDQSFDRSLDENILKRGSLYTNLRFLINKYLVCHGSPQFFRSFEPRLLTQTFKSVWQCLEKYKWKIALLFAEKRVHLCTYSSSGGWPLRAPSTSFYICEHLKFSISSQLTRTVNRTRKKNNTCGILFSVNKRKINSHEKKGSWWWYTSHHLSHVQNVIIPMSLIKFR